MAPAEDSGRATPFASEAGTVERQTVVRDTGEPRITQLAISAALVGLAAGLIAFAIYHLIGLLTNLAFYGVVSAAFVPPTTDRLGFLVIVVPAIGGLAAGLLIKYGSPKIAGHGIPETMEAVLQDRSRVPPRVGVLKAVASSITIGLGGPFGAEGPIIQTGGSFGSWVGQLISLTPSERRILLGTGAAAGMAAIFGTPISAVLLVIELLLFEFRVRSIVPVAIGAAVGAGMHFLLISPTPLFPMPEYASGGVLALPLFVLLGVACGFLAVVTTRLLYASERLFRRLPLRQPWLPVLGGLAVGILGFLVPDVLGVGYNVIEGVLLGQLALTALLAVLGAKLLAWLLAMGSQTSGGTLAPLFLVGASFGFAIGAGFHALLPSSTVPEVFAVAAMAAVFGSAARAPLASSVFALEVTQNFMAVVPIFITVFVAELVGEYFLSDTIMTERLWQRGLEVRHIYEYNPLRQVRVGGIMSSPVRSIDSESTVLEAYRRLQLPDDPLFPYKRFPVVRDGRVIGMLTRERIFHTMLTEGHPESRVGEIADPAFPTISPERTGYQAWAQMTLRRTPYLLVLDASGRPAGILSRSDLMATHRHGVEDQFLLEEGDWQFFFRRRRAARDALRHAAEAATDSAEAQPTSEVSPPTRVPGGGSP